MPHCYNGSRRPAIGGCRGPCVKTCPVPLDEPTGRDRRPPTGPAKLARSWLSPARSPRRRRRLENHVRGQTLERNPSRIRSASFVARLVGGLHRGRIGVRTPSPPTERYGEPGRRLRPTCAGPARRRQKPAPQRRPGSLFQHQDRPRAQVREMTDRRSTGSESRRESHVSRDERCRTPAKEQRAPRPALAGGETRRAAKPSAGG